MINYLENFEQKAKFLKWNLQEIQKWHITWVYWCWESSMRALDSRRSWLNSYTSRISNSILKISTSTPYHLSKRARLPGQEWSFAHCWNRTSPDQWWRETNDGTHVQWKSKDGFKNYSSSNWTASFDDRDFSRTEVNAFPLQAINAWINRWIWQAEQNSNCIILSSCAKKNSRIIRMSDIFRWV